MRLLVFYVCWLFQFSLCERAPTWDECGCRWASWQSWSSCTKTCGGGSQVRNRKVWNYITPNCEGFEACATNDMGNDYRSCNTKCYNGGTYEHISLGHGYCDCLKGKKGRCCEYTVECGTPSSISNGRYSGSYFSYGNSVRYYCNTDYKMTDTSAATRTCKVNGFWDGRLPSCRYFASCKSSPCRNGATCNNIFDGYICYCRSGWTGKNCNIDIQSPVVDECPNSRSRTTPNMTVTETWKEPLFSDPLGQKVIVTKNYQTSAFTFPWGEFTVQYTATKPNNGLSTECVFNINVLPHPCEPLKVPENGIIACNGWQSKYAKVCKILCKKGYAYPPGFSNADWFNCAASGNWFPSKQPLKCVPEALRLAGSPLSIFECGEKSQKDTVASYYLEELKSSAFYDLCEKHETDCSSENVEVFC